MWASDSRIKLFKVWLNDGSEQWLLIHIEIQGDYDKDLPERMLNYNAAARQLYDQSGGVVR